MFTRATDALKLGASRHLVRQLETLGGLRHDRTGQMKNDAILGGVRACEIPRL